MVDFLLLLMYITKLNKQLYGICLTSRLAGHFKCLCGRYHDYVKILQCSVNVTRCFKLYCLYHLADPLAAFCDISRQICTGETHQRIDQMRKINNVNQHESSSESCLRATTQCMLCNKWSTATIT